jgi:peptide-methionine (S)-S-oxide reductase
MKHPATPDASGTHYAYLGGGCFWCIEAQFQLLPGVVSVLSGYAGGLTPHPSYEEVCSGRSGHAEIIRVEYDPARLSYEEVLHKFWLAHDPTTLNRQGNDVGTQYRSVIFYTTPEEQKLALESLAQAQAGFPDPIITEISQLSDFFPAEAYHQNYFNSHPGNGYCSFVVRPKVEKFKKYLQR